MKNNVLLIGDIGLFPNSAYHVGDEAMFLVNYRMYKNLGYSISAISRSISHEEYNLLEELVYPSFKNVFILQFFLFLTVIYKITGYNVKKYSTLLKAIKNTNLIHISGGGNLNSTWKDQLYLRIAIINASYIFGKTVVFSGQTIGPKLSLVDRLLLKFTLPKVQSLSLREKASYNLATTLLNKKDNILLTPDDTYINPIFRAGMEIKILETVKQYKYEGYTIIGLSFHFWKDTNYSTEKIKDIISALRNLSKKIVFLILPHSILPSISKSKYSDLSFMESYLLPTDNYIYLEYEEYFELEGEGITASDLVFQLTGECHLVFATRYHAIVFSAVSKIPVIYLNYDKYYQVKNTGFLELINYNQSLCSDSNISVEDIKKFILNTIKAI